MSLKFSMLLEAIDRVTAPAKRIQQSMKSIGRHASAMAKDVGKVGREATQITRLDRLSRRLGSSFAFAGRMARHYAGKAGIGSWGDVAEKAGYGVGRLIRGLGGLAVGAAKWAGAAAGAASGFALFDLFGTASKFEQFQIMLENTEGSAAKAKQAMAWVKDFAQRTPYELDQVMEAFVQLKAYGIDPMNGSLAALGDGASGMSKPIMQAVEALADAATGEFERLKEFGIRASKAGNQVTFTYMRNGKEFRRQVRMNAAEMEHAITGIMRERFGGMMAKQATTFSGLISNLKDSWSSFLMRVAAAGIFDKVKAKLQVLLDRVSQLAADGTLDKWAQKISENLGKAFDWAVKFVENTDWQEVANQFERIGKAAGLIADAVLIIAENAGRIGWIVDAAQGPTGLANRYAQMGAAAQAERQANNKQAVSDFRGGGITPSRGLLGPARAPKPGQIAPRAGAGQPVQVGGKISLEVTTPPGTSARVKSMQSNNSKVPLLLQYGRSMGGPA